MRPLRWPNSVIIILLLSTAGMFRAIRNLILQRVTATCLFNSSDVCWTTLVNCARMENAVAIHKLHYASRKRMTPCRNSRLCGRLWAVWVNSQEKTVGVTVFSVPRLSVFGGPQQSLDCQPYASSATTFLNISMDGARLQLTRLLWQVSKARCGWALHVVFCCHIKLSSKIWVEA